MLLIPCGIFAFKWVETEGLRPAFPLCKHSEKLSLGVLKISSFLEFESHHASIIGKAAPARRTAHR